MPSVAIPSEGTLNWICGGRRRSGSIRRPGSRLPKGPGPLGRLPFHWVPLTRGCTRLGPEGIGGGEEVVRGSGPSGSYFCLFFLKFWRPRTRPFVQGWTSRVEDSSGWDPSLPRPFPPHPRRRGVTTVTDHIVPDPPTDPTYSRHPFLGIGERTLDPHTHVVTPPVPTPTLPVFVTPGGTGGGYSPAHPLIQHEGPGLGFCSGLSTLHLTEDP